MALSDACFEFLSEVEAAARRLADNVHWYSAPDGSFKYGQEIDALRRACLRLRETPFDAERTSELIRLAAAVMRYHDTPPGIPESAQRAAEMLTLVRTLQDNLPADEAALAVASLSDIQQDDPDVAGPAAYKLKGILTKLGKPAYDVAVGTLSNIASELAKRILGL